jgi:hypothetical protein
MLPGPGPLGTPPPSRPSYPRRDIWTGRTGVRPLPLRQGPEGLPCGLRTGVQRPLLPPTRYFPSLEILGLTATCDFSRPHWVSTGGVQGGGEVRKNGARLWGWTPHYTWFPTSADRIHTLAHLGTDTPSASAAGGKREGGRRDTKAGPGATRIGGRVKRASSGLLTPVVFQIPPWVASSAGRASHMRERTLSRNGVAAAGGEGSGRPPPPRC